VVRARRGAVMSAQLRVSLTNPWLALTVLFTLNAFFFAGLFAVSPRPLPTMEGISAMPWWAPLAGLTGAVAVFAGLALVDKIGAGPVNGLWQRRHPHTAIDIACSSAGLSPLPRR
jgi:transporter family-2 protein